MGAVAEELAAATPRRRLGATVTWTILARFSSCSRRLVPVCREIGPPEEVRATWCARVTKTFRFFVSCFFASDGSFSWSHAADA